MKTPSLEAAAAFRMRRRVLSASPVPTVLETHAADSFNFDRAWHHARAGLALAPDPADAATLARRRPAWSIYQGDAAKAIRAGLGRGRAFDVIDVNAPKRSLAILDALFTRDRTFPPCWHLVVRDRGRGASPNCEGFQHIRVVQIIARYGGALKANYSGAMHDCVVALAEAVGFRVTHWESSYCGNRDSICDAWARLERAP